MNNILKNLGIILLLIGFLCLVVYHFAFQANAILVASLVLEVFGILGYIVANRYL